MVRTVIPAELDYTPSPLLVIPETKLVNGRLPDDVALFYQNGNYVKYHELAYDYELLLKIMRGESVSEEQLKKKAK